MMPGAGPEAGAGWRRWRPMTFGSRPAHAIRDPVLEPLWPGRRVLVHVAVGEPGRASIEIVDEEGIALAGHPDIRETLTETVLAQEAVLDGYLVELPRRSAAGFFGGEAAVPVPGLSATTRQMVVGGRGPSRPAPVSSGGLQAGAVQGPPEREAASPAAGLVGGFVAVDLLSLDGEPLLEVPLLERKRLLDSALAASELVRRGPHVRPPGTHWYGQWRAFGFREIAVKSANGRYRPGQPSDDWAVAPLPRG